MAGSIVLPDARVSTRATTQQTLLNTACDMRLFKNNFTPSPNDTVSAFTEADYTSYASVNLTGLWTSPVQVTPGEYQFDAGLHNFPANTGSSQTVYGVYLTDGGGTLLLSGLFASPVTLTNGGPPLFVVITYQEFAVILL